jgi:hypothetical protein
MKAYSMHNREVCFSPLVSNHRNEVTSDKHSSNQLKSLSSVTFIHRLGMPPSFLACFINATVLSIHILHSLLDAVIDIEYST